jgi:hypothetical protein
MADEDEARRLRKLAAAAEHARWVAEQADAAVADAERKEGKAREDLNAARDSVAALKQQAKEAHNDVRSAQRAAEEAGAVDAGSPAAETRAQAEAATAGVKARS